MMMVTRSLQLFVLLVCSLTIVTIECAKITQNPNIYNVTKTIVHSAVSKGAVCLDGSPPAYYFVPGFGEGAKNWIIQLSGGAWCKNVSDCQDRSRGANGSSKYMGLQKFEGIHSKNKTANPDFYNWNKVIIAYCDGGSFTGDVEHVDPATKLHFRGARIFTAVMEELLAKGLKSAKNAILAGSSAGGYPAILYCDRFSSLLPKTSRVKCLVDCGYFVHFKNPVLAKPWQSIYGGVATLQESAKTLPKSCTSKMKPELCLYAENIQQYIKTPIFIFMSAFDNIETQYTLKGNIYDCIDKGTCTTSQNNYLKEMRSDFLNALPKGNNPKHRGVFIDVVHHHTCIIKRWTPESGIVVHNVSAPKAFADWYFDRNYTYLIDERDLPLRNKL
ncbi:pectin acetylesterase 7-like [Lycium barbarum]|uniref:pectin acetylesterase 7-like n=1 Tax=Lycium barbarum TaxID=112863 RepID=UPI00293F1520|nr:pectin acetylesterase 7-like [Lycium barbarum]